MKRLMSALCLAGTLLLSSACAQGPSEGEFVQACLASGQKQIVTEALCQCGAREAKASLPPKLYQAMVLDMQGKKQEVESLLGQMSFEDRADFAMKQFAVLGKCLKDE